MKLHQKPYHHRLSSLSTVAHTSKQRQKRKLSSKMNNHRYIPHKSRYQSNKLPVNAYHHTQDKYKKIGLKEDNQNPYLDGLRQEAYTELHEQIKCYNEEFIAHMKSMEEGKLNTVPSMESLCSTGSEDSVEELVDLFKTGSIKDYSELVEWDIHQNVYTLSDHEGEYGELW
ncbi:hypothetical protein BDB01DRAFT_831755 [Pilobolus umbonatus]|nr:hypothetical protein BDB01DRAFT_831755 [Pilobolus umbonatus]